METAIFIARIIGPCYIIFAVGMMSNREFYQKVMEDYFKNAALVFFGGLLALLIGFLILLSYNKWAANWTVIITLFGWGGIIKGIWLIVFPNTISKVMQAYRENKLLPAVHSLVALAVGVCLTFLGYFAGRS
ncbi:MAG: hypothetical protein A2Z72_03305 [Omnitrophica bacterium RBG_13_46_9]|nr:MAG: hypothetical protein A2Z72_03305 [Omnitrophica bacterium RBG_13_46_9]